MSQSGTIGTTATPAASSRTPPSAAIRSPGTAEENLRWNIDSSRWVPDSMAPSCCGCHMDFTIIRRRHHCRACCKVFCDGCSSNRMDNKRTCVACWDRVGRRMSGLGIGQSRNEDVVAIANATEAAAQGHGHKSALLELLEDERYNRRFVLEDGRSVSYSVSGNPDGQPVFLFLGLDSHRYSAVLFEDVARRRGLRLICIDRPGRGNSDPLPLSTPPPPARAAASGQRRESQPRIALSEAMEVAVVDTVRQMCAELRIEKAGVMGQSVGTLFALKCARDEGLKDVLGGTTVALVSPWVPLAAPGCNAWMKTTAKFPVLASTAGNLGEKILQQVGQLARGGSGGSGASEMEKAYLQAPYTKDLFKHVSGLPKHGKECAKSEIMAALRNDGVDDARQRCAAVLHPVHIWHGRSDTLVPFEAMEWLEQALPSCTSTVVPGASHALVYDKGVMEEVFAAVQKSLSDANAEGHESVAMGDRRVVDGNASVNANADVNVSADDGVINIDNGTPRSGAVAFDGINHCDNDHGRRGNNAAMPPSLHSPEQPRLSPPAEELPASDNHEVAMMTGSDRGSESESGVDPTVNPPEEERGGSRVVGLAGGLMTTLGRAISSVFIGSSNAGVLGSPLGGGGSGSTAFARERVIRVGGVISVGIVISVGSVGGGVGAVEASRTLTGNGGEAAVTGSGVDGSITGDSHVSEACTTRGDTENTRSDVERSRNGSGGSDDGIFDEFRRAVERALSAVSIRTRTPRSISFSSPFFPSIATNDNNPGTRSFLSTDASQLATPPSYRIAACDSGNNADADDDADDDADADADAGARDRRLDSRKEPMPPTDRVEGKPIVEEWSRGKKLLCHLTAACLAVFIITS